MLICGILFCIGYPLCRPALAEPHRAEFGNNLLKVCTIIIEPHVSCIASRFLTYNDRPRITVKQLFIMIN
jgi:hypothetical protein